MPVNLMVFGAVCSAVLGALVASFVGVVTERLYTGHSIARGRSRCDACGRELGSLDLVPILAYLASLGRCRSCGSRISPASTIAEIVLALLYALAYLKLGLTAALPLLFLILATMLATVLYDLRHMIIPRPFLALFFIEAALYSYLEYSNGRLWGIVYTALLIGIFFFLLYALSRGRAMGSADAPLALSLALMAGPLALSGLFYSFWIGAAYGIVVLLGKPKGHRMGIEVPFAPYLALGFLLAYFTQWNLFALIQALP